MGQDLPFERVGRQGHTARALWSSASSLSLLGHRTGAHSCFLRVEDGVRRGP